MSVFQPHMDCRYAVILSAEAPVFVAVHALEESEVDGRLLALFSKADSDDTYASPRWIDAEKLRFGGSRRALAPYMAARTPPKDDE